MKENKGITLVALVITIIILLILAGISIMVLTNTGLLNKAQKAEQENNVAQVVEDLKLKVMEVQTEKNGNATLVDFVQYLSKDENEIYIISLTKTASIQGEIPDLTNAKIIYVTYKNVECKVDEFLNVEYSTSITSDRENVPTLKGCSRYIDVNVKKGAKQFRLSVDIPDTDNIEKIQYYVDNKKVYEGTEKTYIVSGLQPGREYNIYAIVTYVNEKITKTATAINFPEADIYVTKEGSDDTGDGSDAKPYASVKKAIEMASDGQKIYIHDGVYELAPIKNSYHTCENGIYDMNKKLDIFGNNENTILIYNASKSSDEGIAMYLGNSETIVRNLVYIFEPKTSSASYYRAIFGWSNGRTENVFFRTTGENRASYLRYNSQKTPNNIVNCTFFHDKKGTDISYSGKANFINIATNASINVSTYSGQGTSILTNVIEKAFGEPEDTIQELIEKSKNDTDFNTNQVGVFYGQYAWDK